MNNNDTFTLAESMIDEDFDVFDALAQVLADAGWTIAGCEEDLDEVAHTLRSAIWSYSLHIASLSDWSIVRDAVIGWLDVNAEDLARTDASLEAIATGRW